jgi:hypothetical protein
MTHAELKVGDMDPTPTPSVSPIDVLTPHIRFGYYGWPIFLAVVFVLIAAGCAYAVSKEIRSYYPDNRKMIAGGVVAVFSLGVGIFFAVRAYNRINTATAVIGGVGGLLVIVLVGGLLLWLSESSRR